MLIVVQISVINKKCKKIDECSRLVEKLDLRERQYM